MKFNDPAEMTNGQIPPRLMMHGNFTEFRSGVLPCLGPMSVLILPVMFVLSCSKTEEIL